MTIDIISDIKDFKDKVKSEVFRIPTFYYSNKEIVILDGLGSYDIVNNTFLFLKMNVDGNDKTFNIKSPDNFYDYTLTLPLFDLDGMKIIGFLDENTFLLSFKTLDGSLLLYLENIDSIPNDHIRDEVKILRNIDIIDI